jgi:hypothetical protein
VEKILVKTGGRYFQLTCVDLLAVTLLKTGLPNYIIPNYSEFFQSIARGLTKIKKSNLSIIVIPKDERMNS